MNRNKTLLSGVRKCANCPIDPSSAAVCRQTFRLHSFPSFWSSRRLPIHPGIHRNSHGAGPSVPANHTIVSSKRQIRGICIAEDFWGQALRRRVLDLSNSTKEVRAKLAIYLPPEIPHGVCIRPRFPCYTWVSLWSLRQLQKCSSLHPL